MQSSTNLSCVILSDLIPCITSRCSISHRFWVNLPTCWASSISGGRVCTLTTNHLACERWGVVISVLKREYMLGEGKWRSYPEIEAAKAAPMHLLECPSVETSFPVSVLGCCLLPAKLLARMLGAGEFGMFPFSVCPLWDSGKPRLSEPFFRPRESQVAHESANFGFCMAGLSAGQFSLFASAEFGGTIALSR